MNTLRDQLDSLNEDEWRATEGFSEDIRTVHEAIFHPFASDADRAVAINSWLQRYQPCLFGRIAAKLDAIHFCFITERELIESDDCVKERISASRKLWKQRALRGEPIHGFLLLVASQRIAYALPDESLYQLSINLQRLANWPAVPDIRSNDIASESLYLRNPQSHEIRQFTFSVDYFATAGDKRWWHDHRIPGGIAFTANSLGHMLQHRAWFDQQPSGQEWALRTAMLTIDTAANTRHGRATWLKSVSPGGPFKEFRWAEEQPLPNIERVKGKDQGSYFGYLHTDHAVRREFFRTAGDPPPPYRREPYAMDFAYIFDEKQADHLPFIAGCVVDPAEIDIELGTPDEWRIAASSDLQHQLDPRLNNALARCREWQLTDDELRDLLQ